MRSKGNATAGAILFVALGAGMAFAGCPANAADPVDLRGKRGVVDPADLKRHDPKPPSLKIKEPPAPERERPSGDRPSSPMNDEGGKPGGGSNSVRDAPTQRYVPPQRPVGR